MKSTDYRCATCDVEGYGERCWCCDRVDTLTRLYQRIATELPAAWGVQGVH